MGDKRVSEIGKRVSDMSTVALNEARQWTEELLDAECTGRKDREGPIRYRLARKIGVPESYLFRLQYKAHEMTDVKGSVYRALMVAHQAYEAACRANEEAAAASRAERLELKAMRHADHQERARKGAGADHARD